MAKNNILTERRFYIMTENEKNILQAKHRLEEAQARDREKERKARTHRLIKEGAVLEKVYPKIREVELDDLESYMQSLFESKA